MLAYIYLEVRQALAVDQGLKRVGRALTSVMEELDGDDIKARTLINATATEYRSRASAATPRAACCCSWTAATASGSLRRARSDRRCSPVWRCRS